MYIERKFFFLYSGNKKKYIFFVGPFFPGMSIYIDIYKTYM